MAKPITPEIEELLQALYLVHIEGALLDKSVLRDGSLREAIEAGFVERDTGSGNKLTAAGVETGRGVVRRHRLAELLLTDILVAQREVIHEEACEFEHILKQGLDDKVCSLLGHPRSCPHGRPIPEGECCRRAKADQIKEVAPLCDGKPGDQGTVAYLATRENREVQKMMAMGILPGATIRLIQRFPSYVFQVGYSQFAVDRPLAEIIYVHWKHADAV